MKEIVTVSFGANGLSQDDVKQLLVAAGHQEAERSGLPLYYLDIEAGSPELDQLRTMLAELGIDSSESVDRAYSFTELKRAPFIYPELRRAEAGFGGPKYGTKFDVSDACPVCGTGARQVGPLRLRKAEIPRSGLVFLTLDHDWMLRQEVAERLSRFSGVELRQAENADSGQALPWFQVLAEYELPQMNPATTGLKRAVSCQTCARDGYFHKAREPLLIAYNRSELDPDSVPDFAHTFEHFGSSKLRQPFEESHFAWPLLIIKPPVLQALRESNVRNLHSYPVELV